MMEHDRESRCGREPIKLKKKKPARNTILMDMKRALGKFGEFSCKEAHPFIILVFDYK